MSGSGNFGCLGVIPNRCTTSGCLTPFETGTPAMRIDYPAPTGQNQELIAAPLVSTSYINVTGTTDGTATIQGVSSTTGISAGQLVYGTNIPANSFVVSKTADTITINATTSGSGTVSLRIPAVPDRLDLAFAGIDQGNNVTYFATYARNGSSASDPFKGAQMLDGFSASYLANADINTMKLADANSDGEIDLFAFSAGQNFVASHVSFQQGGTNYGVGRSPPGTYISVPTAAGCDIGSTDCFPDPIINVMGIQQGYPLGSNLPSQNLMDLGDLNNDDIPDVVVNGYSSRGVAVGLGTSSGDFSAPVIQDLGSGADLKPLALTLADLDQDGFLDIAIVGQNLSGGTTGVAAWLRGNGDGSFANAQRIDPIVSTCTTPTSVSAVDIDLDGRPELAVLCYTSQLIYISRRNTLGTWVLQQGSSINASGGSNGVSMKWGRLTTSGASGVDVAVVGFDATNSLRIINNVSINVSSDVSFTVSSSPGAYMSLYGQPSDIAIADLNSDGYNDLAISMIRGSGSAWGGQFYTCTSGSLAGSCSPLAWGFDGYIGNSIVTGDVNNDGMGDIFVGYQTGRIINRTISRVLNLSW
jgi:hypothetical protein